MDKPGDDHGAEPAGDPITERLDAVRHDLELAREDLEQSERDRERIARTLDARGRAG